MKTGSGLAGQGSTSALASKYTNLVVNGLTPSHLYDIFCYAEDTMLNGMSLASIAASRRAFVSTASGGDYVPPTFSYRDPFYTLSNFYIIVRVRLNEDGTVWCAAVKDHGSGTTAPSSAEIRGKYNVDAMVSASIHASENYMKDLKIQGLTEATTYDIYCDARDASGNSMDGTPAWVPNPNAISDTQLSGLITLGPTLYTTQFEVTLSAGVSTMYSVEPAAWNAHLPRCIISGSHERCNLESWNAPLSLQRALLVSPTVDVLHGCTQLSAVPRAGGPFLALVRRGKCTFREKAARAHRAGYQGIVVIDYQSTPHLGRLPDMTADASDSSVTIPGWLISKSDGEAIELAVAAATTSQVWVNVADIQRKPTLANYQSDDFGLRVYTTV